MYVLTYVYVSSVFVLQRYFKLFPGSPIRVCFSSPVSLKMMSLSLKVGSGSIIARLDDLRKI